MEIISEKSETSFEVSDRGFILAQLHCQFSLNDFSDTGKDGREFFFGFCHDDEVVGIVDKFISSLFKLLVDDVTDKVGK